MIFKTTLSHAIAGSMVISEPDGLKSATLSLDRHPEFFSLIEGIEGVETFYGQNLVDDGGREWIKGIETTYGCDAIIDILNEISQDGYVYETFSTSTLPIHTLIEVLTETDLTLQPGLSQQTFWTKFIARYETPVNVQSATGIDGDSVDVVTPIDLPLPSQKIPMTTSYEGHSGADDTNDECYVATTANITLSGHQTIDGILTTELMRVLVKDQTDPKENGIYEASSGAWSRSSDANTDSELEDLFVTVLHGTVGTGLHYRQTTKPVTIGVTNIVFAETDYVTGVEAGLIFRESFTSDVILSQYNFNPGWQQITKKLNRQELTDAFVLPTEIIVDLNNPGAINNVLNILEMNKIEGELQMSFDMDINLRISGDYSAGGTNYPTEVLVEVKLIYKVNNGVEVNDTTVDFDYVVSSPTAGSGSIDSGVMTRNLSLTKSIDVKRSDLIYAYLKYEVTIFYFNDVTTVFWSPFRITGGFINSDNVFSLESTFPESNSKGFLNHDLARSIVDRIISTNDSFTSDFLGGLSTTPSYGENGCGYAYINLKGLQLRGYDLSTKPFFISMKDWWDIWNPILNLGLGYTADNKIEIKEKKDYFDDSSMNVLLSNVSKITRKYDDEHIPNLVEIGYDKWGSKAPGESTTSSIDDPQSKRTYANLFKNLGKKFSILSKGIAASLAIEWTRRTTITSSADYEYDNEVFVIAVVEDSPGSFTPELDENFSGVTGLLNEDTRYNKRLTVARNMLRWLDYFSGMLQTYLSSFWTFQSGEGNYDMQATMTADDCAGDFAGGALSEKQNIAISSTPLFIPILFTIEHKMTFTQWKAIIADRHKSVGISQSDSNHKAFFIKNLKYNLQGNLMIDGWFKEPYTIQKPSEGRIFTEEFSGEFS